MKKIVFLLIVLFCGVNAYSQYNGGLLLYEPATEIEDGTYEAVVDYSNSSTNYSQRYTLTVVVDGDRVVQINFGNGGYIRYNPYEYGKYEGGNLSFKKNYSGQIVGATTTVRYREDNGSILTFKIQL
jgi:hypothetical protein